MSIKKLDFHSMRKTPEGTAEVTLRAEVVLVVPMTEAIEIAKGNKTVDLAKKISNNGSAEPLFPPHRLLYTRRKDGVVTLSRYWPTNWANIVTEAMANTGQTQLQVCKRFGVSDKTFRKRYLMCADGKEAILAARSKFQSVLGIEVTDYFLP